MGHALNASCQDVLIRWHRMRDFNALWQPGYDHAGIALQAVMVRRLAAEGIDYRDARARGVRASAAGTSSTSTAARSWAAALARRLARLPAPRASRWTTPTRARSCASSCTSADKGYVYRANRIVNWCTGCASTVSDLEVDHIDVDDTLTWIRYPLADGSGHVTIATVRPATMLADVAVAVHPNDERYQRPRRQGGDRPDRRAPRADHRRRARRARLRHRRAEDHARPRPDRLGDRARPLAARADGDRPRRADERGGRPSSRG